MDNIAVLLIGMKPDVEGRLAAALGQHQTIRATAHAAAARAVLHSARPAVAVVSLDGSGVPELLELMRELATKSVGVVAVGQSKDPESILAAMRAGAREYLEERELDSLEQRVQALLVSAGAMQIGKVTAVLPAKGGMGATTLATNLAGALQRRGQRVCLADLDLELGDVLSFLDLRGTYSIADIAANIKRLDRDLLDHSVPRHSSGVWVLSQTEKMSWDEPLDAEKISSVIRFLRPQYDQLVLDGVHGFGDLTLAALDVADRILLVVTQEVPAVRDAQRCMEIFGRLGYEQSRIALVVNRFQKSSSITPQVIEETVGIPVSATVGNDFQALSRSVSRGVLVWEEAPHSAVAKDIEGLAALLTPERKAPARPSLLKKLFSPRSVLHGAQ